jgi:hypothetical protein
MAGPQINVPELCPHDLARQVASAEFLYINSVSLAYSVELETTTHLSSLTVRNVLRVSENWNRRFSTSFYHDKLGHFEDPFESSMRNERNEYWRRVPCQLFIGATPEPQFKLTCLYNYFLYPELLSSLRLSKHFELKMRTFVFSIHAISRC